MLRAQKQILLIGWDFDTRICLDFEADDGAPVELGAFLSWLPKHRSGLQIHILKWDVGAIKLLGRGTTVLRLARWAANKQIHFKLDGAHAVGASHHHKIVVIDDRLAFCGGIDMTGDRWDTRSHVDDDEHRRRPTTKRRYHPWHDATMAVDGKVADAAGIRFAFVLVFVVFRNSAMSKWPSPERGASTTMSHACAKSRLFMST